MSGFRRYAIYYLPDDEALARFGAAWLGWDVERGVPAPHPEGADLDAATATPRKYGFHATLKPPFRLADGMREEALHDAVAALAADQPPVRLDGLDLATLGHFLALVPRGDTGPLGRLAFRCVKDLDRFRAPPSAAELDQRRAKGLTPRQDAMLLRWGYPYVGEEFQFHMTLSGGLPDDDLAVLRRTAAAALPPLPQPFDIASIALVGERLGGMFQRIHRYALTR